MAEQLHPNNHYSAQDIQVLDGLEAVRRRPGMYIGSTDQRGLQHLVYEIVYNSVDEALAGACTHIHVTINTDGSVTVTDNGRGIPVEIHPHTGLSALETVMTRLHAGAKFGGKAYQVSGGLHGVGASVVNALSSWMVVEVKMEGSLFRQEYHRGQAVTPVSQVGEADGSGTTVSFLADKDIFSTIDYDFDLLCQRLKELAYLNRGLELTLEDRRRGGEPCAFHYEGGIADLVANLNQGRNILHPPIHLSGSSNGTLVEVALQYHDGWGEEVRGFANCVFNPDGGTHLSGFRAALTRGLNDYARRNRLLKESEPNLMGEDTREGLAAVVSVQVSDPQFEGQTKSKLGNAEVKGQVEMVVAEAFTRYLEEHPSEARIILDRCRTTAEARDKARKARDEVLGKRSFGTSLPGKLADCSEKDASRCEVFIVEGESAGGSAKQGRDRRFQAILPLKGKILNVEKASPEKIWQHEEIRALSTALGAGVDDQLDLSRLRYHRVIIMTDADVDGEHIRTLLLTFFYRKMKPLILAGHLYIAQPPLYRIQADHQPHWVYSEEEREQIIRRLGEKKKLEVQRYKGLGEMSAGQLWETTMDPQRRTLLQVMVEDAQAAEELFQKLMGDEVEPRKEFIQAHAKAVRNLDI